MELVGSYGARDVAMTRGGGSASSVGGPAAAQHGARVKPARARRSVERSEERERSLWLIEAAQAGDRDAQGELFRRHYRRVARIVFRVTRNDAIVEDLVQDVFIRAFNSLQRFRSESRVETWLHVIAVNVARTWLDGEKRRRRRVQSAVRRWGEPATPEEIVARSEHRQRLRAAVDALPRKYRDAFQARVLSGLSLREASAALGVGVSTVSFRTLRAEQLLCGALGLEWSPPRSRRQRGGAVVP